MRRLVFSPEAETDLIDIWAFVAADDIRQADRLVDEIRDSCEVLARFPRAGRLRPTLRQRHAF